MCDVWFVFRSWKKSTEIFKYFLISQLIRIGCVELIGIQHWAINKDVYQLLFDHMQHNMKLLFDHIQHNIKLLFDHMQHKIKLLFDRMQHNIKFNS